MAWQALCSEMVSNTRSAAPADCAGAPAAVGGPEEAPSAKRVPPLLIAQAGREVPARPKPRGKKNSKVAIALAATGLLNFGVILASTSIGEGVSQHEDAKHGSLNADHVKKYKECLNHMTHERLPGLTAKISQNPEANGMIPHIISINSAMEYMKGLDLNVFRGKRIAMVGDSTLRYPTEWLYPMIKKFDDEGVDDPKYENMTLSNASALVKERTAKFGVKTVGRKAPPPIKTLDGTWIEYINIKTTLSKAEEMQPHIIVANKGMHLMHMCGGGRCPSKNMKYGSDSVIQQWTHYKNDWLKGVYDMAVKVNATLLLFKTTNLICDEIRTGSWSKYSSLYRSFDNKTIEGCYQQNRKFLDTHNITTVEIYAYCKYGQFTEIGGEYLDDQMKDFVREIHENQSNSTLTVGIYNDHDVEGCYSTEDAIHHPLNMVIRLRLLSNTIESYSECSSLERSTLDT